MQNISHKNLQFTWSYYVSIYCDDNHVCGAIDHIFFHHKCAPTLSTQESIYCYLVPENWITSSTPSSSIWPKIKMLEFKDVFFNPDWNSCCSPTPLPHSLLNRYQDEVQRKKTKCETLVKNFWKKVAEISSKICSKLSKKMWNNVETKSMWRWLQKVTKTIQSKTMQCLLYWNFRKDSAKASEI